MSANNIQFTATEIRIAKFMFRHYKGRYNPRQLARALGINHAHATKLCNLLAEKEVLKSERIGNAVYFSFCYDNRQAVGFIEYLLSLERKEFPAWLLTTLHALDKLKPYIKMGLVFGSSIKRKDFNDIDVLLMYENSDAKRVKKIEDEIRKSHLVEKPIRYVDISGKDISNFRENEISYGILSESLIFCGVEECVRVILECRKQKNTCNGA